MLRRLRDEARLAVLVIDHRIGWLRALCDRLVAIQSGRVIANGPTDEVCAHPQVIVSYLDPGGRISPFSAVS
jgi:branched-chain amino acid transport system ATP-binding protein